MTPCSHSALFRTVLRHPSPATMADRLASSTSYESLSVCGGMDFAILGNRYRLARRTRIRFDLEVDLEVLLVPGPICDTASPTKWQSGSAT